MTFQELDDKIAALQDNIERERAELKKLVAERDDAALRAEVEAMDPIARERLKRALLG